MQTWKPLTRSSIDRQEERMTSGPRKVVIMKRRRLMPSMPTLKTIPYSGSQGVDSMNCIVCVESAS